MTRPKIGSGLETLLMRNDESDAGIDISDAGLNVDPLVRDLRMLAHLKRSASRLE